MGLKYGIVFFWDLHFLHVQPKAYRRIVNPLHYYIARARQLSACSGGEPRGPRGGETQRSASFLSPFKPPPFRRPLPKVRYIVRESTLRCKQEANIYTRSRMNDRISQLGGKFRPDTSPFSKISAAHPFQFPRPDPRVFSPVECRLAFAAAGLPPIIFPIDIWHWRNSFAPPRSAAHNHRKSVEFSHTRAGGNVAWSTQLGQHSEFASHRWLVNLCI